MIISSCQLRSSCAALVRYLHDEIVIEDLGEEGAAFLAAVES